MTGHPPRDGVGLRVPKRSSAADPRQPPRDALSPILAAFATDPDVRRGDG